MILEPLTFGNAIWLWALLLLLPLGFLFYWAEHQRKHLLSQVVAERLRNSLVGGVSLAKRHTRAGFLLVAFLFLIVTLAQPRLGYEERVIKSHGRDVMLVMDVSRSMLATDTAPTRLARAQLLAQDALTLLPGDRVGLVAFEGRAFLEAPLTLDHSAVRDALAELDINLIPKGGTNIADAIQVAMSAFGKSEGTERAIILITDGEELEADGVAMAKEAAAQGIKIFTIGMGSAEGSLIPIKNELGQNDFVRDEQGKPVLSKLDVPRLQEIAAVTGGFYEPFGVDAVRTIVEKGIMPMAASDSSNVNVRRPIERYEWSLSIALFFLVCWCLLDERRRQRHFLKAKGIMLFVIASGFLVARGEAASGISAYQQGDYQSALHDFEQQLGSGSSSEALRFDAGAAAYQQQDYQKAATYFTQAMTSSEKKIQQAATYNLANTLVRQGEAASKKEEKLSDWNNAVQHYETVLKADPKNKEAQENRDLVKKMIEKLKEEKEPEPPKNQPQQPSQDQKNKNDKNDKNDQKNQGQSNQQDQKKEGANNSSENNSSSQQPDQTPPPSHPNPGSGSSSGSGQGEQSNPSPKEEKSSSADQQKQQEEQSSQNQSQQQQQQQEKQSSSASSQEQQQQQQQNQPQSSASQQNQSAQNQGAASQPTTPQAPTEKKEGELGGGAQGKQEAGTRTAQEGTNSMMSPSQAEAVLRSMEDEERRVQFQQHKDFEETTRDW